MSNIFLAPRSNETSHENFASTIQDGVPYSLVEPYLSEEDKQMPAILRILQMKSPTISGRG